MNLFIDWFLGWPERVAAHFQWLAPLLARITTGWIFLFSGWGKLNNLPLVIDNFRDAWGIPFPDILAPLVAGIEFVGGLFLLVGLLTRISAGALGVIMIVAIRAARWDDVGGLFDLLGLEEFIYLALFFWLAVAGPGPVSLDHVLTRRDR
jgi:putative oxidoreductase